MMMHGIGEEGPLVATSTHELTEATWDGGVHHAHGDLLQSWQWGAFKELHGWDVTRVRVDQVDAYALAQVMFRHAGPFVIAYIPRGPIFSDGFTDHDRLWATVDEVCTDRRSVVLVVEPDKPLPSSSHTTTDAYGFSRGPEWFQTARTVKVPLTDDDSVLAQMRKDTRYNIQYAQRHGVTVERISGDRADVERFYSLLSETARRNGFGIHRASYYRDFLRIFGDQSVLLLAHAGGMVTAGLIAARCGPEGRSMYAGSGSMERVRGDAALLRFEAMRWTREAGGIQYDLGGIAPTPSMAGSNPRHTLRSATGLEGVDTFKTGFGGSIVTYPPTCERRYRAAFAWLLRHVNPKFRAAPGATGEAS